MRLGVRWARRCSLVLTVVVVCLTGSVRTVTEPSVTESAPYREVYGGRSTVDHVDMVSSVDVVETVDVVNSAALEPVAGRRLLLVSTLDGRLTALDPAAGGAPLWTVTAQEGGMLSSTLTQNLQLSQQGQWVRLIPALDGRLFSYDGEQVEALPVTADTLLQASYRFADDTVIMGGSQVSTLGIDVNTGRLRYRCGAAGCARPTSAPTDASANGNDGDVDGADSSGDVLVLRQHTQTVRAVEPRSGQERWNFSVSRHELTLSAGERPPVAAPSPDSLITADLAEGTLSGTEHGKKWQHRFAGPLVHVWRLDGGKLHEVDLLAPAADDPAALRPLLYLGVHEKQLYIQQSKRAATAGTVDTRLAVSAAARDPPQVKWKPYMVSASSRTPLIHGTTHRGNPMLLTDRSDKALALRPEEYPYEGGYYLYSSGDCVLESEPESEPERHGPFPHPYMPTGDGFIPDDDNVVYVVITSLSYWWPQILLLSASIAVLLNLLVTEHYRLYYRAHAYRVVRTILRLRPPHYVVREVQVPVREEVIREVEVVREVVRDPPPVEQPAPRSNFLENFEPVQCLGKGGFGVVFEAKNLLDDHHYAVKRIRLPDREKSRRRVLREVSCLAKLEHRNIVRYFYCWKEQLSVESLHEQDRVLDTSEWASSPTPLNSVASGGGSAPASPEDLSGSVLKLTRFSSALPGGGERSGRQRTIGGGFLPALADSSPRRRSKHGDSSALSADDSIVFSNDCSRVAGRFSSIESSGTFSVQNSDELAAQRSASGVRWHPSAGVAEDSLLSAPTADGDEDDSVVFAAESGQPLVDYTIPDTTRASSSAVSGPLVAFQTNRSPGQDGTGFWDDEEEDTGDAPDAAAWYLFIQMQLCRKESLKDWLHANSGPRSPPRVFAIFRQILNGVEYVHSQGLMHRDLKPSNIFFAPDGTVKIGDFGLATTTVSGEPTSHTPAQLSSAAGGHTDQVGTQLYMSPEQVLGRSYDYRVDIYSLGIILFELLVPFSTQMERQHTLTQVRRLLFPESFQRDQPAEYALLELMLSHEPARRPSIAEIRRSAARCRSVSRGPGSNSSSGSGAVVLLEDELDSASSQTGLGLQFRGIESESDEESDAESWDESARLDSTGLDSAVFDDSAMESAPSPPSANQLRSPNMNRTASDPISLDPGSETESESAVSAIASAGAGDQPEKDASLSFKTPESSTPGSAVPVPELVAFCDEDSA
ncbi:eukaryotic translation initiation factor 2-alpha kinase-like isoform X1 [Amphibalanus amphitrite]|uniref:eukaryotic translation initiation factor 2-alpha kinase-like isoform X1 n=1 Tax=Amphibalanus amphitrite TaxID=1232801 RepID=UPI001C904F1E|nr:eukaryotic translation initiation factor 2-alpha kinase-like isoform X1 [Amphibalanus amphitrite]